MEYKKGDWIVYVMSPMFSPRENWLWSPPMQLDKDPSVGWIRKSDSRLSLIDPEDSEYEQCQVMELPAVGIIARSRLSPQFSYGEFIKKATLTDFLDDVSRAQARIRVAETDLEEAVEQMLKFTKEG